MSKTGEREAVLEVLTGIREQGTYSHIAVKDMLTAVSGKEWTAGSGLLSRG